MYYIFKSKYYLQEHGMNTYKWNGGRAPLLTSVPNVGEWSASDLGRFYSGNTAVGSIKERIGCTP